MIIYEIGIYRDGGTTLIMTNEGRYWLTSTGHLIKCVTFPHQADPKDIEEVTDRKKCLEIIKALSYLGAKLFDIKRIIHDSNEGKY